MVTTKRPTTKRPTTKRPTAKRPTANTHEPSPHLDGEDPDVLTGYLRSMLLVHHFETRAAEMYARAKIGGYCHLNLGEEATVIGLVAALLEDDYLFVSYRDHGYALARGIEPGRVMAELFGKVTGVSGGWGGSMHLFDARARLLGGYAIVGGQIPLATGAALAISHRHGTEAVVCQFGDGATNIGAFHESLNLAQLWHLPVVYVVVNNQLGMGTPVERSSAEPLLYKRAAAYAMAAERVDGDDPLAVRDALGRALGRARDEQLPTLVEAICFRQRGHSVIDPARYRSEEDLARAEAHDPVVAFTNRLLAGGIVDQPRVDQLTADVVAQVEAAVEFADRSDPPPVRSLFDTVYATPVANAPAALPGAKWQS
ncbi:MAG: thiamine pyrophosphate-dependent enzyme [Acidimicrobiales bacterium]